MGKPEVLTSWQDPMPTIEAATKAGILEILTNVTAEAKSIATGFRDPTGRLLNSISWQIEEESGGFNEGGGGAEALPSDKIDESKEPLTGYVGSNVHYATYVEAGTRNSAPHPFLRPAVAIHAHGQKATDVMKKWSKIHLAGKLIPGENREGF